MPSREGRKAAERAQHLAGLSAVIPSQERIRYVGDGSGAQIT
ncbi:unnamed protein product, partial [marine sediment metagenome]